MTEVPEAWTATPWIAATRRERSWRQSVRGGTREDRTLSTITVLLPPTLADRRVALGSALVADVEDALREVSALDTVRGEQLTALSQLLLRTESVASSKIERIQASTADYARALHGVRSNPSAVSMVAATSALDLMIASVDRERPLELASILAAHRALMLDDPDEARYAGVVRDVQNWVGGSDHSPRGALLVPPPPETVMDYLHDLLLFANRVDVPTLAQAAIAHAQFETIHPFTDGNGRIGRALVNAIFRRRGATTRVVVPLASALVVHRDRYFDDLQAYRDGDPDPLIAAFARACRAAAGQARITAERLESVDAAHRTAVGEVRGGSALSALMDLLPTHPVLSAQDACDLVDAPTSAVYLALDRLVEAEVLRPLTARKRGQVWGVGAILDELDDLGVRIAAEVR